MSNLTCTLDSVPNDLLARVLEWTMPDVESRADWDETLCTDFTSFHRLRLVCKRFSQTFHQHPRLSRSLLVSMDINFQPLSPQEFTGMRRWIHKHAGSIEIVRFRQSMRPGSEESFDCQDAVLGVLAAAQAQLSAVWGLASPLTALSLLPSFSALASCDLKSDLNMMLDLTPLQALLNLKVLCLYGLGSFTGLHLLPALTELAFVCTRVGSVGDPSYGCLSTLCDLSIDHSTLHGIHSRGLVACEALQVLRCTDCTVGAIDGTDAWSFRQNAGTLSHFPPAMTALTQLTALQLNYIFTSHEEGHVNLEWIYGLTALQELTLYNSGPCHIGTNLSKLHRLTFLHLGTRQDYIEAEAEWVLATKWSSMSALKSLTFDRSSIKAGVELLTLSQLVHLQKLSFEKCRVADAFTYECVLQLYDNLSAQRHDIVLSFDEILQDAASGLMP